MPFSLYLLVFVVYFVVSFESGDILKILLGKFSELWSKQSSDHREVYAIDKYRYGARDGDCDVSLIFITSLLFIIGLMCAEVKMMRCLLSDFTQYKKPEDKHDRDFHQLLKELHLNKRHQIWTYPSSLKSYFKQRLEDRIELNHLLKFEWARYESFKDFPSASPAHSTRLASAGFFYVGYQDTVKCFICNLEVNGWMPDDIPLDVHRRRSPHCPFMNEEVTGNISIHDRLEGENNRPLVESNRLDIVSETRSSVIDHRHRRAERNEIRNEILPDPQFDCHVANDESPVNLITQHEDVTTDSDRAFYESNTDHDTVYNEENNKLAQRITCKICLDRICNVVFMPCGHVVSCDACAAMLRKCAICRSPIKGRVRTYMR